MTNDKLTKLERQKEIFNKFSNGDNLVEHSNKYFKVERKNKDNKYFLLMKDIANEYQNKYIFEVTNDSQSRFILKWKAWRTIFTLENGEWRKGFVIVLDNANKWDKEIITSWKKLAKGGEELIDLQDRKIIKIAKW